MIDTVIFDMDGTLLDTLDDLTDAVNAALAACGYPLRTKEEVRFFVGNGVGRLMKEAVPEGTSETDLEDCLQAFKAHYAQHWQDKTVAYEGIKELLTDLKARGIKLAVISNKYEQAVLQLCRDYFPGSFDTARGERAGVPRKPAPDAIYAILEELGTEKEKALYVGDSEVDMATAKNAGLTAVGVTWGFRDRQLLLERGADYIIDQPSELLVLTGHSAG
ncbi:MAG: HAD family hydrolase [Firmicutes bacterium]|nr:HAD family hydrolase [Bacillota bacterium]